MKRRAHTNASAAVLVSVTLFAGGAQAGTPVEFDPDGNGGNPSQMVSSFDWDVGNALVTKAPSGPVAIPLGQGTTKVIQTFVHGTLTGFKGLDGNVLPSPAGLNGTFELSYVAGSGESVTTSADGTSALFAFDGTAGQRNFFHLYYDDITDGSRGVPLPGTGYGDGRQILRGVVVEISGNFGTAFSTGVLDQFITDNWGISSILGQGSQDIAVLVQFADTEFFKSGVAPGTILRFTTQQNLPYLETDPSRNFETDAGNFAANPGAVNGVTGPDMLLQTDASNNFEFIPTLSACRVTGGGNNTSGINPDPLVGGWDGTYAADTLKPSVLLKPKGKAAKSSTVTPDYYDYSFGGQAGANTALPPQPKGQWEHNNHSSPSGLSFAFHGGKNAPAGTQIDEIRCTDPGWCEQARPAPNKQIDFVGVGTFSNISNNTFTASDGVIFDGIDDVIPEPKGQRPNQPVPTYHWFQVHIEDLGEPGSENPNNPVPGANCPPAGSGNNPFADPPVTANIADCGCTDFYRITIYKGVQPAVDADGKVILDANGDVPGLNKTDKIYEVYGYIDGGNFQIHPLTGFDLK